MNRIQIYGTIFVILGNLLRFLMEHRRFKRGVKFKVPEWDYKKRNPYNYLESLTRQLGLLLILFGIYLIGMEAINKYIVHRYSH